MWCKGVVVVRQLLIAVALAGATTGTLSLACGSGSELKAKGPDQLQYANGTFFATTANGRMIRVRFTLRRDKSAICADLSIREDNEIVDSFEIIGQKSCEPLIGGEFVSGEVAGTCDRPQETVVYGQARGDVTEVRVGDAVSGRAQTVSVPPGFGVSSKVYALVTDTGFPTSISATRKGRVASRATVEKRPSCRGSQTGGRFASFR